MFFTLKELVRWLGVTVFEMWLSLFTFTLFTVLVALKCEHIEPLDEASWWKVFAPLFIGDAVCAYFCSIVFIRMYAENMLKAAAFRTAWNAAVLVLLFVFKLLLCQKLKGQNGLAYSEVLAPVFILVQLVMVRACQLH